VSKEVQARALYFTIVRATGGRGSFKSQRILELGSGIIRSVYEAVQCWLNYNGGFCLFFLSRDKAGSYP